MDDNVPALDPENCQFSHKWRIKRVNRVVTKSGIRGNVPSFVLLKED